MVNVARRSAIALSVLILLMGWYLMASDYGDGATVGKYQLSQNGERSTLVLLADHTFQQELTRSNDVLHATGTWRRIGEGGVAFSPEFLLVTGQEPGIDETRYANLEKTLGIFVSLKPSQYYVLWYPRVDSTTGTSIPGTYGRTEGGVATDLILKEDNTFEQTVTRLSNETHARGTWSVDQNGDVLFSRQFLKSSGQPLREDEIASAWHPKGSNLQIEIKAISKSGEPTFRKKQFFR